MAALLLGLFLRSRAVAQLNAAHRGELAAVRDAAAADREERIRLEAEVKTAEALMKSAEENARERDQFLRTQKAELERTFTALSSKALEDSNKSFLDRAKERLAPLDKQLERLEKATKDMEDKRQQAYGSISKELTGLRQATDQYRDQAMSLAEALKGSSQARGRIGEMVLRNIAELAGMTPHCDFVEQGTDAAGNRPDMVVKVPGGGEIPIDAKFPLAAYDKSTRTDDPAERKGHLAQHARDLRKHVMDVSKRDYAGSAAGDSDFTVLFLPFDHLLAAAFEASPGLQDEAFEKRVLITTPVTLVALLRTIALYWRQHQLAENAQEIADASKELMDRLGTFAEHFAKVGRGLKQSTNAFNDAVGSYERRILPAGRKVKKLQGGKDELPELPELSAEVRQIDSTSEEV